MIAFAMLVQHSLNTAMVKRTVSSLQHVLSAVQQQAQRLATASQTMYQTAMQHVQKTVQRLLSAIDAM